VFIVGSDRYVLCKFPILQMSFMFKISNYLYIERESFWFGNGLGLIFND
jgi:hypothetical protein